MKPSTRWFGWIALVTVLHLTEQLVFGLGELQNLKHMIGVWDRWFRNTDTATVVHVTIVAGLLYLAIFSILWGGRAKFAALVALNPAALGEVHHLIESAYAGHGDGCAVHHLRHSFPACPHSRTARREAVGTQISGQAAVSAA